MTESIANIKTVAKRELSSYFNSPVAYIFIVIFLLLAGFFTFMVGQFFENGQAELRGFFMWHPWLYVILVPAIGMRLWSEERRLGTIELLLTMPIATWQAIFGKFIASWAFLTIALVLTFPLVFTVNYLGSPDNGAILTGYFGSALMAGAYLSVTCVTSALSRNQVVSFIISVVVCLFLILCGYPPVTDLIIGWASSWVVDVVASVSVMTHFDAFQRGILDSRNIIYFLSVIVFALFSTGVVIRSHRAG